MMDAVVVGVISQFGYVFGIIRTQNRRWHQ